MAKSAFIPIKNLTIDQAKKEFSSLACDISYHNKLYYQDSSPIISDAEYDQLFQRYESIAHAFPELADFEDANIHLKKVGGDPFLPLFAKKHSVPLQSLKKCYTEDEVHNFIAKIYRQLKKEFDSSIAFTLEPKIDGASVVLRYEYGKFVHAITRGDGNKGDNLCAISTIPLVLPSKVPDLLEIRGEVYMDKSDFLAMNEEIIASGGKPYANPRNTVSGFLSCLDPKITVSRRMKFFVHGLVMSSEQFADGQYEMLEKIRDFGFPINERIQSSYTLDDILSYYHETESIRSSLDYDIDGIVYKVDSFFLQKQLGLRSTTPRWAISHKFSSKQACTRLLDIDIQIGRTGILTPVARLEPINLGGVFITNATLHNEDYIKGYNSSGKIIREGRDIRIGDMVVLKRAGDVIPKVEDVIIQDRPSDLPVFSFPSICPTCKSDAVRYVHPKTGRIDSARRCTGTFVCPTQQLEHLKHFVSRHVFNIEGLGKEQLRFFFNSEDPSLSIKVPADIFTLESRQKNSVSSLQNIPGFAQVRVENLYNAINKRREISLYRFIFSLGIRHVGIEIAKSLAQHYQSYDNFAKEIRNIIDNNIDSDTSLKQVSLIGDVILDSIVNFYQNDGNNRAIEALLREISITSDAGIYQAKDKAKTSPFLGKVLVFTGSLQMSRDNAKESVEKLGAEVSNIVSKKTHLVVVGINPGSKLDKARQLSIEIMYEDEFLSLLKEYL
ncbi:MAG: DNA ligase (NAD(+)) LigA [Candidatus Liberibacter europaeus]|uniref:DNA ligase n=1 Tax=Candidatus Liberibacter europaeus TaxID=744859 RepID=A0A2T4VYD9_9HYPH|nr:DNA ligase (NAD(+)) LigA [Candidatus Liberibacter europaeus]PTL86786.1 MAG: DNA ligase (NAD(+)) LigA [Candidatus Liberibacter europaeus]